MIFKIIILIVILVLLYFIFYKKPKAIEDKNKDISDTLYECSRCGTYVTKQESIVSNGKYFCSKECLKEQ
ncbi:MAG: PP0621 family protein [Arcobacteraceae bacterium]|nr:hypothetical protein [Arcobacteraceae bacterium]MDY0364944.1 PP0621 family protein [Arcobacteraceae bacterium]